MHIYKIQVHMAAHTIVAIPYEEREERGGYARTVVRALPVAVLRPVVGATEAVSFALLGFRNTLQPSKRKEEEARWQ
jgi:autophagy-related protein 2